MTTLKFDDLLNLHAPTLSIPSNTEKMTTKEAALVWAGAGFFVLPIHSTTKRAGSVVGTGWPEKSSRDPAQIEKWFRAGTNLGLAIHLGKSGAIGFDVDDPTRLHYKLKEWITLETVPFQSTRINDPLRGHYIFATPQGTNYGNSKGKIHGGWGEVRGKNGIIVVSPTPHSKASESGQYLWIRTGIVPLLPNELQKLLPEVRYQSVQAIEMSEAEDFFSKYIKNDLSELLNTRLAHGRNWFLGGSRHDACRNLLLVCMKDARAGLYSAREAVENIAMLFISRKPREEWSSPREFIEMTLWAIAQVQQISDDEISLHRESQLTLSSPEVADWIAQHND